MNKANNCIKNDKSLLNGFKEPRIIFKKNTKHSNFLHKFKNNSSKLNLFYKYKYMFLYGALGIFLLDISFGLIFVLAGTIFDIIECKIFNDNRRLSENIISENNYLLSLCFQDSLKVIFTILTSVMLLMYGYVFVISFITSSKWFTLLNSLMLPVENFVPASGRFHQMLLEEQKVEYFEQINHILLLNWLIISLLIPFFLSKILYLILTFSCWKVDFFLYAEKMKMSLKLLLQLGGGFLILLGLCYITFISSFLGKGPIYPYVGEGSSSFFFISLAPYVWLGSFMTISFLSIILINQVSQKNISK